jgi:thiol:disulfide interchange protein DsbD
LDYQEENKIEIGDIVYKKYLVVSSQNLLYRTYYKLINLENQDLSYHLLYCNINKCFYGTSVIETVSTNTLGNNSSFFRQLKHALGVAAVGVAIAMVVIHPVKKSEGISWERFSQARLEQVAREGKYAMVDFYADWCIPCHEMDKTTFQDGRIIAALSKIVCLKADMTNNSSPEVKQWIAQWKVVGVPTTLFIDKSGAEKENLRSVGYTSADDMLEKLKSLQASAS